MRVSEVQSQGRGRVDQQTKQTPPPVIRICFKYVPQTDIFIDSLQHLLVEGAPRRRAMDNVSTALICPINLGVPTFLGRQVVEKGRCKMLSSLRDTSPPVGYFRGTASAA